jgi:Tfp pilus assembly protein FimT
MADMAKYSRNLGFSLLECLVGLFVLQILMFSMAPSFKRFIIDKQEMVVLQDLKNIIEWTRWQALHRHEILYLEPKHSDWKNTWVVYSKNKRLREVSHYVWNDISIQWHGFITSQRLIFYPKMEQNHCNGLFRIGKYQLWLNRLGHMRVTHEI